MKFSVLLASDLDARQCDGWLALRRTNDELQSPYFCPEFTRAVARARGDVRVTVMEDGGEAVGYFPFQREPVFGGGRPVGGPLSDYHGVIARADQAFSVEDLLRESKLSYWEFDHLVAHQARFATYRRTQSVSPAMDLSGGFAVYRRRRIESGSGRILQLERKARKLGREVGPLRFEPETADRDVLGRIFMLKSEQCRRTGVPDFLNLAWTRDLIERILATQTPHFAGVMSALYAGDQLVAAHMGMRSEHVWHWWFPVYEHSFGRYSPGGILLLMLAEHAAARGIRVLDLGKGGDAYKQSFADHEIALAEGCATRPSLGTALRRVRNTTERALRASALVEPIRPALRRVKQWMRSRSYA